MKLLKVKHISKHDIGQPSTIPSSNHITQPSLIAILQLPEISTTMYNIIIRNNGLNGFYKGFYFPLITNGSISAVVYGIYGNVMR